MPDYVTIDLIVKSLTADYNRRALAILRNELPPRIIMEYRYYNTKIFNAVAEIVGEEVAEDYISDIAESRGYSKNTDIYISEKGYYRKKRTCKENIARSLNLIP